LDKDCPTSKISARNFKARYPQASNNFIALAGMHPDFVARLSIFHIQATQFMQPLCDTPVLWLKNEAPVIRDHDDIRSLLETGGNLQAAFFNAQFNHLSEHFLEYLLPCVRKWFASAYYAAMIEPVSHIVNASGVILIPSEIGRNTKASSLTVNKKPWPLPKTLSGRLSAKSGIQKAGRNRCLLRGVRASAGT
jgi:hypothetical protein